MSNRSVTRGYGLLEGFLARIRAVKAGSLIPAGLEKKRILDIGCGSYPLFLIESDFSEKYGLDQVVGDEYSRSFKEQGITLSGWDIEEDDRLPFENGFFSVVSMLAVFEHINASKLPGLLSEIYRVLCPGGVFIMTTPAVWSENIIKALSKVHLISPDEADEHNALMRRSQIMSMLEDAGFDKNNLRSGYFEMFMNMWATAVK